MTDGRAIRWALRGGAGLLLVGGMLTASIARSQQEEDETEAIEERVRKAPTAPSSYLQEPQEYCLTPEEMAVIELVRHRQWELQQREELLAVQEQAVRQLQQEVQAQVVQLEELRVAIADLLEEREAARREGGDALVKMVNQMKPTQASEVLSRMDPMLAAAVLQRVTPRQAGRILGAMDPKLAAELGASLAMDPIASELSGGETP